jgi:hypothetical protein
MRSTAMPVSSIVRGTGGAVDRFVASRTEAEAVADIFLSAAGPSGLRSH